MDTVRQLLTDSRFWSSIMLLINAVLYYFIPDFPKEIWAAINGVAAVIIGTLATKGAQQQAEAKRIARGQK